MSALPRQVVVGHRTWKIKPYPKGKAKTRRHDGLCQFRTSTIWIRTDGPTGAQQANALLHEILHATWFEGSLQDADNEEAIVTVVANILTQVIRDNPKVFDWIADKARS